MRMYSGEVVIKSPRRFVVVYTTTAIGAVKIDLLNMIPFENIDGAIYRQIRDLVDAKKKTICRPCSMNMMHTRDVQRRAFY